MGSSTWSSPRSAGPAGRSAAAADRRRTRRRRWPPAAGVAINPWPGRVAGGRLDWRDGAWVAAIGESETRPQDLWLLPVPGRRPRRRAAAPGHRLAARRRCAALAPGRVAAGADRASRLATGCGSRARSGGRPAATGKRGGKRVPTVVYPHGGPTWQAYRAFDAVQAAPRPRGLRRPRRRLPRLDRLRPRVPPGQPRRVGPRRRARHASTPRAGPPTSPGPTAASRSTAARTAATSCCARSSRSRRCGVPASTCTAIRRSPRASATATGRAASTCTG